MICRSSAMKRSLLILPGVLLAACGSLSNEDLEYLNALPAREQLESKLASTSTAQGLTAQGFGSTSQGLALGEPSKLHDDTANAVKTFNGTLYVILNLLERIRATPPTSRL